MEIKAKTTEKLIVDLNLYILSNNTNLMKQFRLQRNVFRVIFVISFIVLLATIFSKSWIGVVVSFILVLVSLLYKKLMMWLLCSNIKKQHTGSKTGADCSLNLNEDGLIWSNGKSEFNIKASGIKRIVEVGTYFFIDSDLNMSLALDKTNIGDVDKVRKVLKSYSETYSVPFLVKLDWNSNIFSKNNTIK